MRFLWTKFNESSLFVFLLYSFPPLSFFEEPWSSLKMLFLWSDGGIWNTTLFSSISVGGLINLLESCFFLGEDVSIDHRFSFKEYRVLYFKDWLVGWRLSSCLPQLNLAAIKGLTREGTRNVYFGVTLELCFCRPVSFGACHRKRDEFLYIKQTDPWLRLCFSIRLTEAGPQQ